jgi:hypothetical protein
MQEAGEITAQERQAGEEFQRLFRIAELDALRASDPGRVVVSGGDVVPISVRSEAARTQVREALVAVGGLGASGALVLWYVLGLELSMVHFAKLSERHDRAMDRRGVKGALIAALGVLAKKFGIS